MRITDKMLESVVNQINVETNSPIESWSKGKANIGNFHVDHAYGGVQLNRMDNESGGVRCPIGMGFCTKRELYYRLTSFLEGIRFKAQ